jgi:hypothetical protein
VSPSRCGSSFQATFKRLPKSPDVVARIELYERLFGGYAR